MTEAGIHSDVLAYARKSFAEATDPQDRQFYRGMVDTCTGEFDHARCNSWQVPRDEPEYCAGHREALQRLDPPDTPFRMRHGEVVETIRTRIIEEQ